MQLKPFQSNTSIEPFRIRSLEPIRFTSMEQREQPLQRAGNNPFLMRAEDVLIDSGTGAMSSQQWAGMIGSDESYAGARSFYRFEAAVQDITGFKHVIPTHQGRAAEHILFSSIAHPGDVIPSNTHFDTTRAHVENSGPEARDLVIAEGRQPRTIHPFKGNMDLDALRATLRELGSARSCRLPGRLAGAGAAAFHRTVGTDRLEQQPPGARRPRSCDRGRRNHRKVALQRLEPACAGAQASGVDEGRLGKGCRGFNRQARRAR
jgi:Beta-eliminating lyase